MHTCTSPRPRWGRADASLLKASMALEALVATSIPPTHEPEDCNGAQSCGEHRNANG